MQTLPLEPVAHALLDDDQGRTCADSADKMISLAAAASADASAVGENTVAPKVDACPAVALAEAELDRNAEAAELETDGDFRRAQLTMRAEEKDAKQAAKDCKEPKAKAEPKAKGRPRETEDVPAPKRGAKRKAKTDAPQEAAPSEEPSRSTSSRAMAEGGSGNKRPRKAAAKQAPRRRPSFQPLASECPLEDRAFVDELVDVMKKFQDLTYDRKEMTLHTQLLGCISSFLCSQTIFPAESLLSSFFDQ